MVSVAVAGLFGEKIAFESFELLLVLPEEDGEGTVEAVAEIVLQ